MSDEGQQDLRRSVLKEVGRRLATEPRFRDSFRAQPSIFVALPEDHMGYVFLMLGGAGVPATMFVPTEGELFAVRFDRAAEHTDHDTQGVGTSATVSMLLDLLRRQDQLTIHETHPSEFSAQLIPA